ncbi:hypothetical protein K502DRAFT_202390 [Neoconidiobolus thromboides FSU 785]|nr:hypothetical protein K502DRAFT_202390 [Neoconidiobolus thromboides FSU 785]
MKKYTQKRKEAEAKAKAEAEVQHKSQELKERTNSSMSSQLAKEKHKYHMQKNAEKQEKAEMQRKIQELEEDTNGPKENLSTVEKRLKPVSNKKLSSSIVNGNKNYQEVNYQESIHDKTSDDEDNIGGFVKINGFVYKYYELKVRMYDEINHENEIKNPVNLHPKPSYISDSRQIKGSKYSKWNANKLIYSVQPKGKGDDGKPMTKKMVGIAILLYNILLIFEVQRAIIDKI